MKQLRQVTVIIDSFDPFPDLPDYSLSLAKNPQDG
jgi:hypothetical protein